MREKDACGRPFCCSGGSNCSLSYSLSVGRGHDPADYVSTIELKVYCGTYRLSCHCEERSDVAISWYNFCYCTVVQALYREIATPLWGSQ